MPRAEIYIEDAEGGSGADMRLVFVNGFDPSSAAHQLANIIRQQLDSAVTRGELIAAPKTVEEN